MIRRIQGVDVSSQLALDIYEEFKQGNFKKKTFTIVLERRGQTKEMTIRLKE